LCERRRNIFLTPCPCRLCFFPCSAVNFQLVLFIGIDGLQHPFIGGASLIRTESTASYDFACSSFVNLVNKFTSSSLSETVQVVFSDHAAAIDSGVAQFFPNAHHLLCCWHLAENVQKNTSSLVSTFKSIKGEDPLDPRQSFWSLARAHTEDLFVQEWEKLQASFSLPEQDRTPIFKSQYRSFLSYFEKLIAKKERWALHCVGNLFTMAHFTNNISESAHSGLKSADFPYTQFHAIPSFIRASLDRHFHRAVDELETQRNRQRIVRGSATEQAECKFLMQVESHVCTSIAQLIVQESKLAHTQPYQVQVDEEAMTADVSWTSPSRGLCSYVIHFATHWRCSCFFNNQMRLPCRHMFKLFPHVHPESKSIELITLACDPRWQLKTIEAVFAPHPLNSAHSTAGEPTQLDAQTASPSPSGDGEEDPECWELLLRVQQAFSAEQRKPNFDWPRLRSGLALWVSKLANENKDLFPPAISSPDPMSIELPSTSPSVPSHSHHVASLPSASSSRHAPAAVATPATAPSLSGLLSPLPAWVPLSQ